MSPQSGLLIETNEAAATLTLGTDVFRNDRKRVSSRLRYLTGVSVVGSAAIDDASVDIYIEDYFVGRFFVRRAGVVAAIFPDDVVPVRAAAWPAGSQITGVITDAPATNPLKVGIYGYEA